MVTVTTAADWDMLNETLMGFEDGFVREVWVDSGRWLTPDDTVIESATPQVVLLVQCRQRRLARQFFASTGLAQFLSNTTVTFIRP